MMYCANLASFLPASWGFRSCSQVKSYLAEEEQERRNALQETTLDPKINAAVQEPVADICGTSTFNNDTSVLSELEQLLKQKTLTSLNRNRSMQLGKQQI